MTPAPPFDTDLDTWARLAAYVAGEGTPEERAEFERWVEMSPSRGLVVARAQEHWRRGGEPSAPELDEAWRVIVQNTLQKWQTQNSPLKSEEIPQVGGSVRSPLSKHPGFGRGSVRQGLHHPSLTKPSALPGVGVVSAWGTAIAVVVWILMSVSFRSHVAPSIRYVTHDAETKTLRLIDGTTVRLAPRSVLRLAEGFGRETRMLTLDGEAFFTVVERARAPFIVRTGGVTTRVLGTAFGIRHRAEDGSVKIIVQTGRVLATRSGSPVTLSHGMAAVVSDSTTTVIPASALDVRTDWTRGRLIFDKTRVSELLATVERWYGYRFHLTDSTLGQERISIELRTADAADMLASLKSVLDVTMTFDGPIVTLTPRRDRHSRAERKTVNFTPSMEMGR